MKYLKQKYHLLLYLVLGSVGLVLILAFSEVTSNAEARKSIFSSFGTELLAVTFVFLFVEVVFAIRNWDLSENIQDLITRLKHGSSANDFFQKQPDLDRGFHSAKKIDLCGVTLTTTLSKRLSTLQARLFEGADIRILIISPLNQTLWMATKRSERTKDIVYYKRHLDSSLRDLNHLWENWKLYQKTAHPNKGSLYIRFLPYAPSFGMIGFNVGDNLGNLWIELYPHHGGYDTPPYFLLTPEKDEEWYGYFRNQYNAMWNSATEWEGYTNIASLSDQASIGQVLSEDFFLSGRPQINEYLSSASKIHLLGYSLSRTIRQYSGIFTERLFHEANIKVIIIDPEQEGILERMALESVAATPERWKSDLISTKALLNLISKNPANKGLLEIGYLPYTPSFGLIIIDPDSPTGICVVEIYHHHTPGPNATFVLNASDDKKWFDFFKQQYDSIWASCRKDGMANTTEMAPDG
ncbi:MAG: hypothetical protein H6662_17425 [Ardenticatenaceae bacterium]|nr:hypothetical protein [Anaerolineales bacterium]MCB8923370.1 hypothetical protein [Ardenticatenaceae bacterium]